MTTRDYTANVISATKVVPDGNFKDSKASGVWDINEALDLIKGGNWPNAANINPAAFVDGLFSTFLYEGNGGTQTITNNINLSGSGGLVWTKRRGDAVSHTLFDTERGATKRLFSNLSNAQTTESNSLTSFNSNGFSVGSAAAENNNGSEIVSWTFRKQPKFFDVLTYTGTGSVQNISHSLGSVPGCIIVKNLAGGYGWKVYHRGNDASSPEDKHSDLDSAGGGISDAADIWNDTAPTSSVFTLGTSAHVNESGATYIAYLWAHNDNDGGFGPNGDQDIIKCGSYTGDGNNPASSEVTLGFEPQFVFIIANKSGASSKNVIFDSMRGIPTGGNDSYLDASSTASEVTDGNYMELTSTGFKPGYASQNWTNQSGNSYSYIAIRRGGMQTPTTASDVFDVTLNPTSPNVPSDTLVDTLLFKSTGSSQSWWVADRLRQGAGNLQTDTTAAESSSTYLDFRFDQMTGTRTVANSFGSNYVGYTWKRATGYFDVVAYQGTGSAGFTFNHNLGVKPEMIWVKNRGASEYWAVYHKDLNGGTNPSHYFLKLNGTDAETDYNEIWNDTEPTTTQVTVGQQGVVNSSSFSHIAYLFATVAGVSKVGSYTGNGGTQTIDCGFSSGARFVLIKPYSTTGGWRVFDTERGIVSGNDPYLVLQSTNAEDSNYDIIDPNSSGFAVVQDSSAPVNASGVTYIFYAIA